MNPEQWTQKTREAVQASEQVARAHSHGEVHPAHLLLALLEQQDGLVPSLLAKLGVAPALCQSHAEDALAKLPRVEGSDLRGSQELSFLLQAADAARTANGDEYLSTEHLLMALVTADSPLGKALNESGLTADVVRSAVSQIRGDRKVTNDHPESQDEALKKYAQDLTALAREGQIGRASCRERV